MKVAGSVRDEVLWISSCQMNPVGIVKHYDPIEGRWKYYIGCGEGKDLDEDVQIIKDLGQKYYDLRFIADFAKEVADG